MTEADGNLKTHVDVLGVTATYTSDAINRVTQIVYVHANRNQTSSTAITSGTIAIPNAAIPPFSIASGCVACGGAPHYFAELAASWLTH